MNEAEFIKIFRSSRVEWDRRKPYKKIEISKRFVIFIKSLFLERTLAQEESGNHIGCDRHGCKSHMFFWKSFFLLEYKLNSIVTNIGGAKQSLT